MEGITNDKTIKALIVISVVMTTASAIVNLVRYFEEKERNRKAANS